MQCVRFFSIQSVRVFSSACVSSTAATRLQVHAARHLESSLFCLWFGNTQRVRIASTYLALWDVTRLPPAKLKHG